MPCLHEAIVAAIVAATVAAIACSEYTRRLLSVVQYSFLSYLLF